MQKRNILWWMILFQLVCNTLIMISVDIAIVSMIVTPRAENKTSEVYYCNDTFLSKNSSTEDSEYVSSTSFHNNDERFHWTEGERSSVLGGYYSFNYLSILPGGILAHKFGSKLIGGCTLLMASVMAALIPATALYGPSAVAWLRAIQGFLSHMSVPASVNTIVSNWCPPQERGKFGALFFAGSVAGQIVGNLAFGYIAQHVSWTYVFYLTSFCGIIWGVLWYLLIHDSPSQHPTITIREKKYISNSLKEATTNIKVHIPWKSILLSLPVNVSTQATNSVILLWVMMATYGPTYLHKFYGMETNMIGILTGASNIGAGVLIFAAAYLIDFIIDQKILSITTTRKITGAIGCSLLSIPLIIMAFTECNLGLVIVCMVIITISCPLPIFGSPLSISDMSPMFCDVIQAIAQTSTAIYSLILVRLVKYGHERTDWDSKVVWKTMFLGTTLSAIFCQLLFLIFGTSKLQPWNFNEIDSAEKQSPKDPIDLKNQSDYATIR